MRTTIVTTRIALLGVLLFVTLPHIGSAHTEEERKQELMRLLSARFDAQWITGIFNHQNVCEGKDIPIPKLAGGWKTLEATVMSDVSLKRGEMFFRSNETLLRVAAKTYNGPDLGPYALVGILRIESDLGENRTGVPVIRTLFNQYKAVRDGPRGNATRIHILDKKIAPFLKAAEQNKWDVCEVRGSRAAAFGYPHFIPSSLVYAADGDADGKIDIVGNLADASASIAHYLAKSRWERSLPEAIYWYNPIKAYRKRKADSPYVRIVMRYAAELKARIEPH